MKKGISYILIVLATSIITLCCWSISSAHILVTSKLKWTESYPVTIYKYDDKDASLVKKTELGRYSSIGMLYLDQKVRKVFTLDFYGKELKMIDVDITPDVRSIKMPFGPQAGYYLDENDDISFVIWSETISGSYELHKVSLLTNKISKVDSIDWSKTIVNGFDSFDNLPRFYVAEIDENTGEVFYFFAGKSIGSLSARLPEQVMSKLIKSGERSSAVILNDEDDLVILTANDIDRESHKNWFIFYNKKNQIWRIYYLNNYSLVQKIGEWIVIENMAEDNKESRKVPEFTGKYTFVDSNYNTFDWSAGGQVEILSIKGDKILYRDDDKLMEGKISSSNVIAERFLLRDEIIKDVHLGMIDE